MLDEVYLAGLSHDIGIVIFDFLIPDEYQNFLTENEDSNLTLVQLEKKKFGVSHHQLGAAFIKKSWPMSETLIDSIRNQDDHEDSVIKPEGLSSIISFAHKIAGQCGLSSGIELGPEEEISEEELEAWELTEDDIKELGEEIQESVQAVEIMVG